MDKSLLKGFKLCYIFYMKKNLLLFCLIFCTLTSLSAVDTLSRSLLVSPTNHIAYSGNYEDLIVNSAALSFKTDDISFMFKTSLGENYNKSSYQNAESLPYLQNLSLDLLFSFGTKGVSLSGDMNYFLDNRNINSGVLRFDVISQYRLQVDFSYRLRFFSLGFKLEGGNRSQRAQREISSLSEAVANLLFEKYYPISGSEYFMAGASALFKLGYFNITLLTDELIKVMNVGTAVTNYKQIMESLSFGFAFESPRYNDDGNLNVLRLRMGLSLEHLFSKETAVNELAFDINFQILPDISIIIASNLRIYKNPANLNNANFFECTEQAIELKLKYTSGYMSLKTIIPLTVYKGGDDVVRFSLINVFNF